MKEEDKDTLRAIDSALCYTAWLLLAILIIVILKESP